MNELVRAGFIYRMEFLPLNGPPYVYEVHNKMPVEGRDYLVSAGLIGASQSSAWYLGLYSGNYSPQDGDTMATFPTLAGETDAYTGAQRGALTFGAPTGGVLGNAANEFEFTAATTIRGAFITSAPAKGSAAGVLLSAVLLPSPRNMSAGDILRTNVNFRIVS